MTDAPTKIADYVDLPFLFADLNEARTAFDGSLGRYLDECIEASFNYHEGWQRISSSPAVAPPEQYAEIAWSSSDKPSRTDPSAARAIRRNAPSSSFTCSA